MPHASGVRGADILSGPINLRENFNGGIPHLKSPHVLLKADPLVDKVKKGRVFIRPVKSFKGLEETGRIRCGAGRLVYLLSSPDPE